MEEAFEINRLLMDGLPYSFLPEVVFRCVVMYVVAITTLKLAGRRGVKQLSIFELVIILTLGSAAGDALFYEDVGLLPAILVFVVILLLYRFTTNLISSNKKVEQWLEGKPRYLIEDGEFSIDKFGREDLAQDEFFAELRLRNVTHLGQVDIAILETSGQISVFFIKDEEVRYGLPILPHHFDNDVSNFTANTHYACKRCSNVQPVESEVKEMICDRCGKDKWVLAQKELRVA